MPRIRTSYSAPVLKFRNDTYNAIIRYNDRRKRGPHLSIEKRQYLALIIDNKCMELERLHATSKECEAARQELIRLLKAKGSEKGN